MSAYEHLKNSVKYQEEAGSKEFHYSTKALSNAISEIDNRLRQMDELKKILSNVPLQVGDVVHEVGYPDEKGDVVDIDNVVGYAYYTVMIRQRGRAIGYYRDELELMERPEA